MILVGLEVSDSIMSVSILHGGKICSDNRFLFKNFKDNEEILAFCKDLDDISNELRYLVEKREEVEDGGR